MKGVCMNVQSFSNQSFQAKNRERNLNAYNPRKNPRANVDTIISLDDNTIRNIAYAKTMATVDDDKHRKISKAMFWSIPAVAGIATALLNPAKSSVLGKELSGVAARLTNGAKSGLAWGALLGVASGVNAVFDKVEKASPEAKKFSRENPVVSFIGQMAAFVGTVALAGKYLPKLANKVMNNIKPSTIDKFADKVAKNADKLNDAKFTKFVSKYAGKLADSRWFEPLKGIAKTTLSWSPSLLLWGGVLHSINHSNVREREFVKNYSDLKDFQSRLAQARIRELSNEQSIIDGMRAHQA